MPTTVEDSIEQAMSDYEDAIWIAEYVRRTRSPREVVEYDWDGYPYTV